MWWIAEGEASRAEVRSAALEGASRTLLQQRLDLSVRGTEAEEDQRRSAETLSSVYMGWKALLMRLG